VCFYLDCSRDFPPLKVSPLPFDLVLHFRVRSLSKSVPQWQSDVVFLLLSVLWFSFLIFPLVSSSDVVLCTGTENKWKLKADHQRM
jgi:hypothetical protein